MNLKRDDKNLIRLSRSDNKYVTTQKIHSLINKALTNFDSLSLCGMLERSGTRRI